MAYKIKAEVKKVNIFGSPEKEYSYESGHYSYIYRNKNNPSLTVEIHRFNYEDNEDKMYGGKKYSPKYYVFSARNGEGIQPSPYLAVTLEEAKEYAKDLMKNPYQ